MGTLTIRPAEHSGPAHGPGGFRAEPDQRVVMATQWLAYQATQVASRKGKSRK